MRNFLRITITALGSLMFLSPQVVNAWELGNMRDENGNIENSAYNYALDKASEYINFNIQLKQNSYNKETGKNDQYWAKRNEFSNDIKILSCMIADAITGKYTIKDIREKYFNKVVELMDRVSKDNIGKITNIGVYATYDCWSMKDDQVSSFFSKILSWLCYETLIDVISNSKNITKSLSDISYINSLYNANITHVFNYYYSAGQSVTDRSKDFDDQHNERMALARKAQDIVLKQLKHEAQNKQFVNSIESQNDVLDQWKVFFKHDWSCFLTQIGTITSIYDKNNNPIPEVVTSSDIDGSIKSNVVPSTSTLLKTSIAVLERDNVEKQKVAKYSPCNDVHLVGEYNNRVRSGGEAEVRVQDVQYVVRSNNEVVSEYFDDLRKKISNIPADNNDKNPKIEVTANSGPGIPLPKPKVTQNSKQNFLETSHDHKKQDSTPQKSVQYNDIKKQGFRFIRHDLNALTLSVGGVKVTKEEAESALALLDKKDRLFYNGNLTIKTIQRYFVDRMIDATDKTEYNKLFQCFNRVDVLSKNIMDTKIANDRKKTDYRVVSDSYQQLEILAYGIDKQPGNKDFKKYLEDFQTRYNDTRKKLIDPKILVARVRDIKNKEELRSKDAILSEIYTYLMEQKYQWIDDEINQDANGTLKSLYLSLVDACNTIISKAMKNPDVLSKKLNEANRENTKLAIEDFCKKELRTVISSEGDMYEQQRKDWYISAWTQYVPLIAEYKKYSANIINDVQDKTFGIGSSKYEKLKAVKFNEAILTIAKEVSKSVKDRANNNIKLDCEEAELENLIQNFIKEGLNQYKNN